MLHRESLCRRMFSDLRLQIKEDRDVKYKRSCLDFNKNKTIKKVTIRALYEYMLW